MAEHWRVVLALIGVVCGCQAPHVYLATPSSDAGVVDDQSDAGPVAVVDVVIVPSSLVIPINATRKFHAAVNPAQSPQAISWSVQEGADCGTIDANGLYTAPAAVPGGVCHVVATSSVDPAHSNSATVTVTPVINSVTVTPSSAVVAMLTDQQFQATVGPADAPQTVKWSATCGGLSNDGLYFPPNNVLNGTCQVVATSTVDPTVSGSAMVTIVAPVLMGLAVSPAAVVLATNTTQQFSIVATPADANTSATWSIQEGTDCGTVDSSGLYTAPATVPAGPCHITVTSTIMPTLSGTASATIMALSSGPDLNWSQWRAPSETPPDSEYAVSSDGLTVTDSVTGLEWQRAPASGLYTWAANAVPGSAQAYCESLSLGDHSSGWRLPTAIELLSITDLGVSSAPTVNPDIFPGTPANPPQSQFWTATQAEEGPGSPAAWLLDFATSALLSDIVTDRLSVRCVWTAGGWTSATGMDSGGPPGRYTIVRGGASDATVFDGVTGLTWQQLVAPEYQNSSPVSYSLDDARQYCLNSNVQGFNDWRVPTAKELASITDYEKAEPAVATAYFPEMLDDAYLWTSTAPFDGSSVFLITSRDGDFVSTWAAPDCPMFGCTVRCVR